MADNEHHHVPTREVVGLAPVDPLIAFYWARLDEAETKARAAAQTFGGAPDWQFQRLTDDDFGTDYFLHVADRTIPAATRPGEEDTGPFVASELALIADRDPQAVLDDVGAKKAILDDYARYCADVDNPARELICQVTRDVIKRLATVYAGHPDYDPAWRP
ncbi:DUF6221 family protein [Amycolatopsis eburnea]|uniref:Uncharacterized protein n=1 Tax=Amycolatopsis eburnea TaxID=2267691 RepID=A0A3R9E6T3_9PSEU|nr:DUF6221 family protein [Amycolatopsis eburnea]RSD21989.1 hypothetical protein EIY87_09230 [Amycolatopsis eburnea]